MAASASTAYTITMRSFALPLLSALVFLGTCRAQSLNTQASTATTNGLPVSLPSTIQLPTSSSIGKIATQLSTKGQTGLSASGSTSGVATAQSSADQVQKELATTMDTVNANLAEGVKSMMNPLISFLLETAPNMGHLYWLMQGCPVRREVVNVAKDMWGQGAVKMAQLMGRGFTGGSEMAKGAMEGMGNALSSGNDMMKKATSWGIDAMYNVADLAMSLEMKKLDLLLKGLQLVFKALEDAGPRAKEVADTLQVALKAVQEKVNTSLKEAQAMLAKVIEDGGKVLNDGRIQFESIAKEQWYNLMSKYVDMLLKVKDQLKADLEKIKAIEDRTNSSVDVSLDVAMASNVGSGVANAMKTDVTGTSSNAVNTGTVADLNMVQVQQ